MEKNRGVVKAIHLVLSLSLPAVIVAILPMPVMAYTTDGYLDDWGVNLSEDWSLEETWVPSSPGAYWTVEDNIDCSQYYSKNYCGVHISGVGTSYTHHAEPRIILWKRGWWVCSYKQPYHERVWSARSRELNDIEAMYFDTNETHAFFAILTSIPRDTVMGDLAIDLDGDPNTGKHGYEYGIDLEGESTNNVYLNSNWSDTNRFKGSGPYRVTDGTVIGTAKVEYVDQDIHDHGYTNWVIEVSVPKSVFGDFVGPGRIHTTLYCGNDIVEITQTPQKEIPEFSHIAIPLTIATVLFYYYSRKRRRR